MITAEEIDAARTDNGGWTREQLSQWGVPWPPPKGWRRALLSGQNEEECSVSSSMEVPQGMQIRGMRSDGPITVEAAFRDGKMAAPFARIFKVLRDVPLSQEISSIAADTERALKRAIKRAEELDGAWERVEFVPTRGPTTEFTGRLIGEDTFTTRGREPLTIQMQVWETKAGALVAVDETTPQFEGATPKLAVQVCPPSADVQEQRFAVIEHFGWSSRARSMARKLGWSLRVEID